MLDFLRTTLASIAYLRQIVALIRRLPMANHSFRALRFAAIQSPWKPSVDCTAMHPDGLSREWLAFHLRFVPEQRRTSRAHVTCA